ncbi:MAG: alkaline phosphatase family protein [Rudaea sp.]|uniref:alkaline phosphatase family protein n=1 Tax=Rudaea sp. TaxID=2136325 RepID=UPI0039E22ECC
MSIRRPFVVSCAFAAAVLGGCVSPPPSRNVPAQTADVPARIGRVFVIVLENKPFDTTFGTNSPAPYLAHELVPQGALLRQYFAIGHFSLDNYIAMISGQAPNIATQGDCGEYSEFVASDPVPDANGQLRGKGCVYPASIKTVADQIEAANLDWKGYMEDMGNDPAREAASCGHAKIGTKDPTLGAEKNDQYAAKHDPFVYFHSIIDDEPRCERHVVNLDKLPHDLQRVETTPNYAFITPNLCHDGHDEPCVNREPGGLVSADAFLRRWVPRILESPAFKHDGLLVVTFDEALANDSRACCGEAGLPGNKPGLNGPGGGRIGALLLSPRIRPGTVSDVPYNHYSLLRWTEDNFGLPHLGYAGTPGLATFGDDVFGKR